MHSAAGSKPKCLSSLIRQGAKEADLSYPINQLGQPKACGFDVGIGQPVTSIGKTRSQPGSRVTEKFDQTPRFGWWNERILISRTDPYVYLGKIRQLLGHERHPGSKQNSGTKRFGPK